MKRCRNLAEFGIFEDIQNYGWNVPGFFLVEIAFSEIFSENYEMS